MNGANYERSHEPSAMEVEYLIVGTGPAGAALAAFMAPYGN